MDQEKLALMLSYARAFIGVPYRWGGEHPSEGFDCSGFVQAVLASVGLDPPGDQTAQTLYVNLKASLVFKPEPGAVLFFGKKLEKITHVALAIDELHMIEAGGGDRTTRTLKRAIEQKAYVRIRPIKSRHDLIESIVIT